MRVGISCYDISVTDLIALGSSAERLGFSGIWLGEHVLTPTQHTSEHPRRGEQAAAHDSRPIIVSGVELTDPMVAFAAVATQTHTLRLATGIYLMPLRHPLLVARAVATLAEVSAQRFSLGVGAGWLREEFTALSAAFSGRASRLEEQIAVMRAALSGGPFEFHGEHYDIAEVQLCQRPLEVPVVMGGNSEPALRRAVRLADGWYSSGVPTFDEALRIRDRIAELSAEFGRPMLPTTFRVASPDTDLLERYAAEGLDDLVVMKADVWTGEHLDARRASLAAVAARLGLVSAEPEDRHRAAVL